MGVSQSFRGIVLVVVMVEEMWRKGEGTPYKYEPLIPALT